MVIHPFTTATLYFRGVAIEECTIMFFSILIPISNLVNPKDISKYDDKDGAPFLFWIGFYLLIISSCEFLLWKDVTLQLSKAIMCSGGVK